MITIANGQLQKRSKLMTLKRSVDFAKCLRANKAFTTLPVFVRESNRTEAEKRWYVIWTPASLEKRDELTDKFASERATRAVEQAGAYQFAPCDDRKGWYYCISQSGEFYVVSPTYGCDTEGHGCADMLYRGNQTGQKCKHYHALNNWLNRTQVQQSTAPAPKPSPAKSGPRFRRTGSTITAGQVAEHMRRAS